MSWWDLLFPVRCVGCRAEGGYLCSRCVNMVQLVEEPICPMCAKPSMRGRVHARCQRVQGMDGLVAGMAYKGVVRAVVRKYKFRYVESLVETLGELVLSLGALEDLPERKWVVVPVPLHVRRKRWRGFNQAVVVGEWLAGELGWRVATEALERVKHTKTQSELSRKERLVNVQGAFGAGDAMVQVKDAAVVLVDDVWTTGATMRECTKVLKRNGVKDVWGLVVAR